MKKISILFCLFCCCIRGVSAGVLCGPGRGSSESEVTHSTFTENSSGVPIAYFALGTECGSRPVDTTDPLQMCTTVDILGQAACVGQYWSEKDVDVSAARAGNVCWCRRTHVRVNGELVQDVGPWSLVDDRYDCTSECAYNCMDHIKDNDCSFGVASVMLLPRY